MKNLILVTLFIILNSCKSDTNNPLEKEDKTADTTTEFDINYIKSKTTPLSKKITLKKVNVKELNKIPKEFIKTHIVPLKIDIGNFNRLKLHENYAFYEFKEYENFYLYTFIHDSESCCRTLFASTLEKNTLKPIQIAEIGHSSGDGSWVGKKYGEWINDYNIENVNISIIHEGLTEQGRKSKIDSTWCKVKLTENGSFKYSEQHTIKYIGEKQVF